MIQQQRRQSSQAVGRNKLGSGCSRCCGHQPKKLFFSPKGSAGSCSRILLSVLVVLLSITATTTDASDWFDIVDSNHDGVIDRTEYDVGLDRFMAELEHGEKQAQHPIGGSGNNRWLLSDIFTLEYWNLSTKKNGFWKGFTSSTAMILATEIGDKTFFIAAVLSMKHDRRLVFCGAIMALIIMTVLSTAMGLVLPKFLDKKYTHILSGLLFLYFGIKLIWDSRQMEGGKVSEELEEVEEELLLQQSKKDKEKGGDGTTTLPLRRSNSTTGSGATVNYHSVILTALSLTFLAEWGDRSQIATIALGSSKHPVGVTVGGVLGHCICTSAACIGGRMLASNISEKTVSQFGGTIFLLFAFHSLFLEE